MRFSPICLGTLRNLHDIYRAADSTRLTKAANVSYSNKYVKKQKAMQRIDLIDVWICCCFFLFQTCHRLEIEMKLKLLIKTKYGVGIIRQKHRGPFAVFLRYLFRCIDLLELAERPCDSHHLSRQFIFCILFIHLSSGIYHSIYEFRVN